MENVKVFLKNNWPYVVGGIIGLFLVMRFYGGNRGGASSSGVSGYGEFLAGQAQLSAVQGQLAAENTRSEREYNLGLKQLSVQESAVIAQAQIDFQKSQALMAQAVMSGSGDFISALTAPSIHAMNNASYENTAALLAAASVASEQFRFQGDVVYAQSGALGAVAHSLHATSDANRALFNTGGSLRPNSTLQDISGVLNGGANLAGSLGGFL